MKKSFLILFLLLISSVLYCAFGQEIVTDRPDQTESSSTVGIGALQIESGFLLSYEAENGLSKREILAPTTLFRFGLSKSIELRLLSQFESLRFRDADEPEFKLQGISDIEIGAKVQIFKKPSSSTEIAFLTHLVIPKGTGELTDDTFISINKLSVSHVINDRMGLGYNVGYNYQDGSNGVLTYSAALGVDVNEQVAVYIEPFGEWQEFETFQLDFDAGFTVLLRENIQLDFSFGTGITREMNYLSTGVSWLIPKG